MITYQIPKSDSEIWELLIKMKEEGTLNDLFYGDKDIDLDAFVDRIKEDHNIHFFIGYCDGKPGGFVFLDTVKYLTAQLHMCMLSEFWHISTEAGQTFLDAAFKTFNMIIGIYPKALPHVTNYMRKIGAEYKCTLPGYVWNKNTQEHEDAEMYIITRDKGV